MSNDVSDIKSCLEYLENHVGDDEEVEIILFQEEEEDSIDGASDHENGADGDNDDGDTNDLPTSTRTKKENTKLSTAKSIYTPGKLRFACGKTTADEHNAKTEKSTVENTDDPGVSNSLDETNETNDCVYVATECKIKDINPRKPLGKYQCLMCEYNAHEKCLLKRHLVKHFPYRAHKCPVCNKGFKLKENLKIHLNAHMDIKPFQCAECDKAFVSASKLSTHKKQNHSGMKPIKCTECDYSTVNRYSMKVHATTHMDERPYKCSSCTYAATCLRKLKFHMMVHTGAMPFKCDLCHSMYRNAVSLRDHREVHTNNGKNRFKCSLCPVKLRNNTMRNVHMRKVHKTVIPKKNYKCPHCERSYSFKANLLHHMKTHDLNSELKKV